MVVMVNRLPLAQDPRIVIECIRACVWARIEGWPFSPLSEGRRLQRLAARSRLSDTRGAPSTRA